MVNNTPVIRLRKAPTDTCVRLHYENSQEETKTETGVKTDNGGPIDAAKVEIQTEPGEKISRTLRINNGGFVEVEGSNEEQRIGRLQNIEFLNDNSPTVSLEHPGEIDWLANGRQDGEISAVKARREYIYQSTKELLQGAAGPLDAEASAADVDAAHSDFRDAVNMTEDDLQAWGNHDCSDAASVKPKEVRQRVRDLLTTPTDDWGTEDVADARNVADFITRLNDTPRGDPAREGCPPARDVTLMNWGYKPDTNNLKIR